MAMTVDLFDVVGEDDIRSNIEIEPEHILRLTTMSKTNNVANSFNSENRKNV